MENIVASQQVEQMWRTNFYEYIFDKLSRKFVKLSNVYGNKIGNSSDQLLSKKMIR